MSHCHCHYIVIGSVIARIKSESRDLRRNCVIQIKTSEKTTKEKIQEWAGNLERLVNIGAVDYKTDMICSQINNRLAVYFGQGKYDGLVYSILPDKYKLSVHQRAGELAHEVYYQERMDELIAEAPKQLAASLAKASIFDTIKSEELTNAFETLTPVEKRECIPKLEKTPLRYQGEPLRYLR